MIISYSLQNSSYNERSYSDTTEIKKFLAAYDSSNVKYTFLVDSCIKLGLAHL